MEKFRNFIGIVFLLLTFNTATAVELQNFAVSSQIYDENTSLSELEQEVKKEFGSNYRIATWSDLVAYQKAGNTAKDFEEKLGEGLSVTYSDSRFYSSTRTYFMSISHRPERTPHSGYLSHANINIHEFDLGSWYGGRHTLVYTDKPTSGEIGGCRATYKNGSLNIPCVDVIISDQFGSSSTVTYEVDMQYQQGSNPMFFGVTGINRK